MKFLQSDVPADVSNKPYQSEMHDDQLVNYFLEQCPNGITGVRGSEKLVQKNVFTNIDVVYANNSGG